MDRSERIAAAPKLSIQGYARIGGVLVLISLLAGGFGESVAPSQVIVSGNAAATAHHVVASNSFFRLGFAAYLVEAICDVALSLILYVLLRPVHLAVALLAVFFRLISTTLFAVGEAFYFAPLLILGGDPYLRSFSPEQLNSLALLSLNLYGVPAGMSLMFYGIGSICVGYLIYRSGYLPRILGILWVLGGLGFVTATFVLVLAPLLQTPLFMLPTILAVLLLGGWLLVEGVDSARWEAASSRVRPLAS